MKKSQKGFALGALLGGLLGGMTALLFAPKSGAKMRKTLAKKCHQATDRACEVMDDVSDHSNRLCKKAKNLVCGAKMAASKFLRR